MRLISTSNPHENWFEVIDLWQQIATWSSRKTSNRQLRSQIKQLLVLIWNEKDWLKSQYPDASKTIEHQINCSKYICIVGDLANTVKHRHLNQPPRSGMKQTDYFAKVTLGDGTSRMGPIIELNNGKFEEIFVILKGAIDEFSALRLRTMASNA